MILKVLFALTLLSVPNALAAEKKTQNSQVSKNAPTKTAVSKRKPAQQASYTCRITRHTEAGSVSDNLTLNDRLKFEGIEKFEAITLTNSNGRFTVVVDAFLENPSAPYLVDRLECDLELNCQGGRSVHTAKGVKKKKYQIVPHGRSAVAVLGMADVIRFSRIPNGFQFTVIQVGLPQDKYLGVDMECTSP